MSTDNLGGRLEAEGGSKTPHASCLTPHASTLLYAVLFFCLCGVALDSYLVYTHIMYRKNEKFKSTTCAWISGEDDPCKQVNTSKYSEFMGIPVAVFGTAFFAWIFLLTFFALFKEELQKFLLGISLLSSGMNVLGYAFLTFKSVTELHHLCPLCITSATIMTIVFLLTLIYFRSLKSPSSPTLHPAP